MGGIVGIIAVFYVAAINIGTVASDNQHNGKVPDRCATFEKAHDYDSGNVDFCKAWKAAQKARHE